MNAHDPGTTSDRSDASRADDAAETPRKPTALNKERLDPAPLDASMENVEQLFAPDDDPDDVDYGAQPPG